MGGIYLHIPFCRKACFYCDFHFSTSFRTKDEMIAALMHEAEMQKGFFNEEEIDSVYFGGGTPSVLSPSELSSLLDILSANYRLASDIEVTMEVNPDDLSLIYLKDIRSAGINRLSIGIQSFFEEDLKWMNRSHNAVQARESIVNSGKAGFNNINVDLIYGYPLLTSDKWEHNLRTVFESTAKHLSAYSMTVEGKTVLNHQVKTGKTAPMDEVQAADNFKLMLKLCTYYGWEQYEISNFCRDGYYSRHNSAYWKGSHYLGLGPGAHSFNGTERSWNVRNNALYIEAIKRDELPSETEKLSLIDRYNEMIMTGLRTKWGVRPDEIEMNLGIEFRNYFETNLRRFSPYINRSEGTITLNGEGKLLADHISSELFMIKT